jgi:hypothetical protein
MKCEFSIDGQRFPASHLGGAPFFARICARESPNYPISTKSSWPDSLDISGLNCVIAPPKEVTLFQPPGTRGTRMAQPRVNVGDEIVLLLRDVLITSKIRDQLLQLSSEVGTQPGALRDHPDWKVYWIRVPDSGTRLWNLLSEKANLQEAREKWLLDLLLPLPISTSGMGEMDIPACDKVLVRIERRNPGGRASSSKTPHLVWEHGGKVLKVESELRDRLNPHYLEVVPPEGARAATLWTFGEDSTPSSISLRFNQPANKDFERSLLPGLVVNLDFGDLRIELEALNGQAATAELGLPCNLVSSDVRASVRCANVAVPVKFIARSAERMERTYREGGPFDTDFADYVVRMARKNQPIDLMLDAAGWGCVSVRILPPAVEERSEVLSSEPSPEVDERLVRWRMLTVPKNQRQWIRDSDGRGRLARSFSERK